MSEKIGEPKKGNTKAAGQKDNWMKREQQKHIRETSDRQDATDDKILTWSNQENLQNTFDEKAIADDEELSKFSQSFMDGMRAMVADEFGEDAAEQFMVKNQYLIKEEKPTSIEPEAEKEMSQITPAAAKTLQPKKPSYRKWLWRAAAMLIVILAGFTVHRTARVNANKIPAVSMAPETNADYSKVGSLKDIISTLDYTSFPQEIKQVYVPEVVAEGYQETERSEQLKYTNIFYANDSDGWYKYRQVTVEGNTFMDTEEGDWTSVMIGQYPGVYIDKDGTGNLWWFDYTYAYQLEGSLSEDEMMTVAESLAAEK